MRIATFDVGEFRVRSVLCALAMSILSFSILPFSIAVFSTKSSPKPEKYIKVYSASEPFKKSEVKKTDTPSRSTSLELSKAISSIPTVRESAHAPIALDFSVERPDVSISKLGVPHGASLADFEISNDSISQITVFELSELDKIPRRLREVHVNYPASLLRRGMEGEVVLKVEITPEGSVEVESVVSSTNQLFERAAIDAVKKLKYESPMKNGERVRAKFILPIPFKILK